MNTKPPWQFTSVMNCDLCKYYKLGCKIGDCGDVFDCPYETGWIEGQEKLLIFQRDHFHRPEYYQPLDREAIKVMLEILES